MILQDGHMHKDEVVISTAQAAQLIGEQFPQWAGLPLMALWSGGSDNVLIQLGGTMVLRFPRLPHAATGVASEARWLPFLAPHLPLAVPQVLGEGKQGAGYRHNWSVLGWLDGQDAFAAPPQDQIRSAEALAGFIRALRTIPMASGMPLMQPSGHLRARDAFTQKMLALITDEGDPAVLRHIWAAALDLPAWQGTPCLVHAVLHPLNVLTTQGMLSAVIDWGGFCAGDPAHDLICAWTMFGPTGRAHLRDCLAVDDTTWARGRALAFSKALMAAPYYRDTNPRLRDVMRATLLQTVQDWPA